VTDREALAERVLDAIAARRAIAPLTATDPGLSIDDAYAIQDLVVTRLGGPSTPKLGLTSKAKQQQMLVDSPLFGWFPPGAALERGAPLAVGDLIQPRVEPEIAFVLARDLRADVDVDDVLAATERVVPALDVLDSRFEGYGFTLADVVADDASAARFAIGAPGAAPEGFDLRLTGCVLEVNGDLVATASGAAVLDHPAAAVAWLAAELGRRDRTLTAGTTILAGALTAAVAVHPGDVVTATFDRIGTVELRCT
jgi:2-oxo-3-hexenedioate decarboxylase